MASSSELYRNVADILEYKASSDIRSSDTSFIANMPTKGDMNVHFS